MASTPPPTSDPTPDASPDQTCPICQHLFYKPVKTTCGHILCGSCMSEWASVSSIPHDAPGTTIVPLDEPFSTESPSFTEANCPMCRTRTTAVPDHALARTLERAYPEAYAARRAEEETEGQGYQEWITVFVGNKHSIGPPREEGSVNWHDWTFFVQVSKVEVIKAVRIWLHPTFNPPRIALSKPPFEIRCQSWGGLNIITNIVLKEGYYWFHEAARATSETDRKDTMPLGWELDFDGEGCKARMRLKIGKE